MRGINLVQWLFKKRLGRESRRAVAELESVAQRQQETAAKEIARLSKTGGAAIELGTTTWKQPVRLPANEIANHSLIVGASGSGKSFLALSLICQLLDQLNPMFVAQCLRHLGKRGSNRSGSRAA